MANDNPDWARLDVGRISTIRGAGTTLPQNSVGLIDATFTDPLLWTIQYNVTYFNCTEAACQIGVVGVQSGTPVRLIDVVTPAATNLLYIWGDTIVWSSAIDLTLLLPLDTSYQLRLATGPTTATGAWGITVFAGAQL